MAAKDYAVVREGGGGGQSLSSSSPPPSPDKDFHSLLAKFGGRSRKSAGGGGGVPRNTTSTTSTTTNTTTTSSGSRTTLAAAAPPAPASSSSAVVIGDGDGDDNVVVSAVAAADGPDDGPSFSLLPTPTTMTDPSSEIDDAHHHRHREEEEDEGRKIAPPPASDNDDGGGRSSEIVNQNSSFNSIPSKFGGKRKGHHTTTTTTSSSSSRMMIKNDGGNNNDHASKTHNAASTSRGGDHPSSSPDNDDDAPTTAKEDEINNKTIPKKTSSTSPSGKIMMKSIPSFRSKSSTRSFAAPPSSSSSSSSRRDDPNSYEYDDDAPTTAKEDEINKTIPKKTSSTSPSGKIIMKSIPSFRSKKTTRSNSPPRQQQQPQPRPSAVLHESRPGLAKDEITQSLMAEQPSNDDNKIMTNNKSMRPPPPSFSSVERPSTRSVVSKKNITTPQQQQSSAAARTHQQSKMQARPQSRPPRLRTDHSNDAKVVVVAPLSSSSSSFIKRNMVSPKSHQRLVLENVAARYFMRRDETTINNARYVGVADYGYHVDEGRSGGLLGNIDENYVSRGRNSGAAPSGLCRTRGLTKDGEAVLSLLGGSNSNSRSADDECVGSDERANIGIISEATSSSSAAQDIVRETNIDCILEIASDHLSLGKNDLALQAYRRAMKVAFADVISVKNKLVEVKKGQENLDPTTADLTRDEERRFELSLLKVAARVADVHNNMGVVHEMNRQYEKARSSYMDALEVYHNTCKRFEENDDPDVDRTKKNVERMTLACNSELQRKALHEKAAGIAKRIEEEMNSERRKNLLNEVVATLRRALDLESETIGLTHPVAAGTLIQIGKYHYEMREYDSAVLEIRQAITIFRNALGGNHPQVGKSTLLLASIFERHGLDISPRGTCKDDSELELYVDALEPLKATLGEVHAEIGFLYAKIGYLYGKKGDMSLSLLAYKASLKAYGEPSSNDNNLDVMSIWVRITENLTGLKAWDEVLVAGHRALYLLRRSRNTLFATELPATTTKKLQIRITSDTYSSTLFTTLQSLGQAHTSLSNYALARDACSESLQLAWEMALSASKANAENEALTASVTRVVRALKRLGKAYLLEKQYAPALECFLPSLELLRSSKEMESTLDCASVLGSLGFLYLKLNKYAESSNFLRECLRLYDENGVDSNDRETRKIDAWLEMAESREGVVETTLPCYLEIPTIVFQDEIVKFG